MTAFVVHSVYRRRAVPCLIAGLLLIAACGDPDTAQQQASSTPTAQSETSSMRAFPTRDLCPPRPRSAHENQSGPIYVAAGSIAAGHQTNTPEELAARSEMVVDGRVVRLTSGRTNEFWGYVNVHLRVEQNRADKPAPEVAVFEQAVCENPSGRPVLVEGQLEDIRVGDRLRVYLDEQRVDGDRHFTPINGIGLFRIDEDGDIQPTDRDDPLIRRMESRPVPDEPRSSSG